MPAGWTGPAVLIAAMAVKFAFQFYLTWGSIAGKRSGYVTTACLFFGYVGCFTLAAWRLFHVGGATALLVTGALLFVAGFAIRTMALARLGKMFSSWIEIRKSHELVSDGIYGVVRHPLHLGFFLEGAGMAVFGWWTPCLAPLLLLVGTVLYRNVEEERALGARFPDAYPAYAERVPGMNLPLGLARRLTRR